MPVIERAVLGALAALAVLLGAAPAYAVSETTVLQHMISDQRVKKAAKEYDMLAAGTMVDLRCASIYPTDAAKAAFDKRVFDHVSAWYMEAMATAHQHLTGKLPSKSMYAHIVDHLRNQQIDTKQKLDAQIQQYGCDNERIKRIVAYWNRVRANEKDYMEQMTLKKKES